MLVASSYRRKDQAVEKRMTNRVSVRLAFRFYSSFYTRTQNASQSSALLWLAIACFLG